MKFGVYLRENVFNPWRIEYIQYDLLKQDLKHRQLDHEWNEMDEANFSQVFFNERNKVIRFINNFNQQLISRIRYAEHLLKSSIINFQTDQQQQQTIEFLNTLDDSLMEIIFDIYDFSKFIHFNKMGFAKILKKHKKWTLIDHVDKPCYEYQSIDLALGSNWDKSFYTQTSLLRNQCQQKFTNGRKIIDGDIFDVERLIPISTPMERKVKKYWVHPEHVSEVTAILCTHAFVVQPLSDKKQHIKFDFSMSNVYFENNHFDVYSDRLACMENAQTIKCKRYGSLSNDNIYFENELYNAPYTSSDISTKKRFRIDDRLLNAFYKGEYKVNRSSTPTITEEMDEKEAIRLHEEEKGQLNLFAKETQKTLVSSNLVPIIQCDYQRMSFQTSQLQKHSPETEKISITLDTDIYFTPLTYSTESEEEKPLFLSSNNNQLVTATKEHFSYAVLEIKSPAADTKLDVPSLQWLSSFTQKNSLIHEVPEFSKYLQGIYQMYSATNTRLLSSEWAELYSQGVSSSTKYNNGLSRSRSLRPLLNGKPFRSVIPYSAAGNINTERSQRKSLQQQENLADNTTKPSFYSSIASSSEFTAISITTEDGTALSSSAKKGKKHVDNEKEDYKVVLNMNEKTEMNCYQQPFFNNHEKSVSSSSFLSTFFNKRSNNNKRILDQDGNPIQYTNQQMNKKSKKESAQVVKIEPKVFFANERTFISWLQFCALLLTVALNLLNFGDQVSKICGGMFLFISMLLALYALGRFQYRAWQLRHPNQTGRFDDLYGPAVLCILIVAALVINFCLRFKYITEGQNLYPGSSANMVDNSTTY